MTSTLREIEFFSQSLAVLESSSQLQAAALQDKLAPLKQRLRSKVTIEEAQHLLEQATRRGVEDEKRACERALAALLDFLPRQQALALVRAGLHANNDASTRLASLDKLVKQQFDGGEDAGEDRAEALLLVCDLMKDADSRVALRAAQVLAKQETEKETDAIIRSALLSILRDDQAKRQRFADWSVWALRIWDFAAQQAVRSTSSRSAAEYTDLLDGMFEALEQPHEDVLFVLNLLEIASGLPRPVVFALSSSSSSSNEGSSNLARIERTLMHYARTEDLLANDALRVLAALQFDAAETKCAEEMLHVLYDRAITQGDLSSLDVVALFAGHSEQCLDFTLTACPRLLPDWLVVCLKHCHGGNEAPRNVALDALALLLRGGVVSGALSTKLYTSVFARSTSSNVLPVLLPYVESAARSLHVQVQLSAYGLCRVLATQEAEWGVATLFQRTSAPLWFNPDMPSPNATVECREARWRVLQESKTRFLHPEHDSGLVDSIQRAVRAGPRALAPRATLAEMETRGH